MMMTLLPIQTSGNRSIYFDSELLCQPECAQLSNQGISGNSIGYLLEGLLERPQYLTVVNLSFNNIKNDGARLISEYLLLFNQSITSIDLSFNDIGDEGARYLADALIDNTIIKSLYLSGNCISHLGFQSISNALTRNDTLSQLHLSGNAGGNIGISAISDSLGRNTALKELSLSGNNFSCEGAEALANLFSHNHSIRIINVSNNDLDDGIEFIGQSLLYHRKIETLIISFCQITEDGMPFLCDMLQGYHNMRCLRIDNNSMDDNGAKILAESLKFMSLQELNVAFNHIQDDGIVEIVKVLTHSQTIESLNFSGNTVINDACCYLGSMLKTNKSIKYLYMDNTNLTKIGEKHICSGVASNADSRLEVLTGIHLGSIFLTLGSPLEVSTMKNDAVLKYLRNMWKVFSETTSSTASNGDEGNLSITATDNTNNSTSNYNDSNGSRNYIYNLSSLKEISRLDSNRMQAQAPISHASKLIDHSLGPLGCSGSRDCQHVPANLSDTNGVEDYLDILTRDFNSVEPLNAGNFVFPSFPNMFDDNIFNEWEISSDQFFNAHNNDEKIAKLHKELPLLLGDIQTIKLLPFNAIDLFQLHQHYFSPFIPSSATSLASSSSSNSIPSTSWVDPKRPQLNFERIESDDASLYNLGQKRMRSIADRIGSDDIHRISSENLRNGFPPPKFRTGRNRVMIKIDIYPRIAAKLNTIKLKADESRVLMLLRILRYVEKRMADFEDFGIESLILDQFFDA